MVVLFLVPNANVRYIVFDDIDVLVTYGFEAGFYVCSDSFRRLLYLCVLMYAFETERYRSCAIDHFFEFILTVGDV